MKCPVCNIDLIMGERFSVEIDYCSKCRGVWLDRGKLDKIVEGSTSASSQQGRGNREDEDEDNKSIWGRLGQLFD